MVEPKATNLVLEMASLREVVLASMREVVLASLREVMLASLREVVLASLKEVVLVPSMLDCLCRTLPHSKFPDTPRRTVHVQIHHGSNTTVADKMLEQHPAGSSGRVSADLKLDCLWLVFWLEALWELLLEHM